MTTPLPPDTHTDAARLTDEGAAALRAGDRARAYALLTRAVRADPNADRAWLWLSGAVAGADERRFCLERALALNPQNEAARRGLAALTGAPVSAGTPAAGSPPPPTPTAPARVEEVVHTTSNQSSPSRVEAAPPPYPANLHAESPVQPAPPRTLSPPLHPQPAPAPVAAPVPKKALVPAHPWASIWIRPGWTIGGLAAGDPGRDVLPIALVVGFGVWLLIAHNLGSGDHLAVFEILGIGLVMGPLLGSGGLLLGGRLLSLSGSWLGGGASPRGVRTALAWAAAPLVAGQLLWLPLMARFGSGLFTSTAPPLTRITVSTLVLLLGTWSFGMLLPGLAAVHRFSLPRAFAALLLALLTLVAPLVAVLGGAVIIISLRGG